MSAKISYAIGQYSCRERIVAGLVMLLLFSCLTLTAADQAAGKYTQIKVNIENQASVGKLLTAGVALDHVHKDGNFLYVITNGVERAALDASGLIYEIVVEDLAAAYAVQNSMTKAEMDALEADMKDEYPILNFDFGSMGGYYTFAEVVAELDEMAATYPSLISTKSSIGQSIEGRELWMVKISDNPAVDEAETEVLYTALHHAREPQSMATVVYFMWYLLENYGVDSEVTYLVDNRELYFVPVVNPDGYVYNESTNPNGGGFWRKNRRVNGGGTFGVDLNRNYGYQWGYDNSGSSPTPGSDTYRGTAAFSEPETQAIRDFCNSREFVTAFNYHSYSNLLIYPWGYIANFFTPDHDIFVAMGEDMTQFNNYTYGTANQTVGYLVNGEANDWFYGEQSTKDKIFALTPEVGSFSDGFWPSTNRIFPLAQENVYPNIQLAWALEDTTVMGIPCGDISAFQARCNNAGSVQMRVTFNTADHNGKQVQFTIDGSDVRTVPIANQRAQLSLPNYGVGAHTVALSDPAGCYAEVNVTCNTLQAEANEWQSLNLIPAEMVLEQNYPNPFNPTTEIRYGLSEASQVKITIYNTLGQAVKTLVNDFQDAGYHNAAWNATNDAGQPVASGIYLYTMRAGNIIQTAKMFLSR